LFEHLHDTSGVLEISHNKGGTDSFFDTNLNSRLEPGEQWRGLEKLEV